MKAKGFIFLLTCALLLAACDAAGAGESAVGIPEAGPAEYEASQEAGEASEQEAPAPLPESAQTPVLLRETDFSAALPANISLRFAAAVADTPAEYGHFLFGCAWIDDNILMGLHVGGEEAVMVRYDDETGETVVLPLELSPGRIGSIRAVSGDLLVEVETGWYLLGGDGTVKKSLRFADYGIDPDRSYNYKLAIDDAISRLAYFEFEYDNYVHNDETQAYELAEPGWHRMVLLDIATGARTVLDQGEFPQGFDEYYPIAPVAFSASGEYLFYEHVIFRGHDGMHGGGRMHLETVAREEIPTDDFLLWIRSASGDDQVLLTATYTEIHWMAVYDFESGRFTQLPIRDDPNEGGGSPLPENSWYLFTDSWNEFRLYDLHSQGYVRLFSGGEEPLPALGLGAVSPDGRKVGGFACDGDGAYLISVFEVL